MNTRLPSLITIRLTDANGAQARVIVTQALFPKAWKAAQKPGVKAEALISEVYL